MKSAIKKILFGGAIFSIAPFLFHIFGKYSEAWIFYGFFYAITILITGLTAFGMHRSNMESVFFILGGVVFKMLLSMIFALVYLLNYKVDKLMFAASFFSIYILFTSFEIYILLTNLRDQKKFG
jgi:hypothetical protein